MSTDARSWDAIPDIEAVFGKEWSPSPKWVPPEKRGTLWKPRRQDSVYAAERILVNPRSLETRVHARRTTPEEALQSQYLQTNDQFVANAIVLDIDKEMPDGEIYDSVLPDPHVITVSRRTGNGHAIWYLDRSVNLNSKIAPKYLSRVRKQMCRAVGADCAYNGLLTQNPLHDNFHGGVLDCPLYSLKELDETTRDWKSSKADAKPEFEIKGRNTALFSSLHDVARRTAYRFDFDPVIIDMSVYVAAGIGDSDDARIPEFITELEDKGHLARERFDLPYIERYDVAKSVASFAVEKYDDHYRAKFRESQSKRRKRVKEDDVLLCRLQGMSINEISEHLNLSVSTIKRYVSVIPASDMKRMRDERIISSYKNGESVQNLSTRFSLSTKQIRRIVA